VQAQYDGRPAERVTLTPAAINSARAIIFLVTGREKAQALAQVLEYKAGSEGLPAGQIRPLDGSLTWLVDQEAAAHLDDQTLRSYRQPANNRKGDPHDKAE
jgi:6-phosphogluconolactonase